MALRDCRFWPSRWMMARSRCAEQRASCILIFQFVMGDAKLGEEYGGVLGLPMTFLIDRDGKIAEQFKGENDLSAMEGKIQLALRK